MSLLIRPSGDEDLPAIHAIYTHHVDTTLWTLDIGAPSLAEMAVRRAEVLNRGLPFLVGEDDEGAVVGYAYATRFRARSGFDNTVEDALYLAPGEAGKGFGRALLAALIDACTRDGYRQMLAVIGNAENVASIGLHTALGFRRVALLPAIGFKFDRWLDCVLMQRPLGAGDGAPPDRAPSS